MAAVLLIVGENSLPIMILNNHFAISFMVKLDPYDLDGVLYLSLTITGCGSEGRITGR